MRHAPAVLPAGTLGMRRSVNLPMCVIKVRGNYIQPGNSPSVMVAFLILRRSAAFPQMVLACMTCWETPGNG
jgi:hypothetical protein